MGRVVPLAKKVNTRCLKELSHAKHARRANLKTLLGLELVCLAHLVLAPQPAAWTVLIVAAGLDKQVLMVVPAHPVPPENIRQGAVRPRAWRVRRAPRRQREVQGCKNAFNFHLHLIHLHAHLPQTLITLSKWL